jgi:hypothetical protein
MHVLCTCRVGHACIYGLIALPKHMHIPLKPTRSAAVHALEHAAHAGLGNALNAQKHGTHTQQTTASRLA